MNYKTKIFGLILSILGVVVSSLAFGIFVYLSFILFQSLDSLKNEGLAEMIAFIIILIVVIVVLVLTIILFCTVIYSIYFLVSVIKACRGGNLKILRKIGIAIAIIYLFTSVVMVILMVRGTVKDFYFYLIPILLFLYSVGQIMFYNAYKKEQLLEQNQSS